MDHIKQKIESSHVLKKLRDRVQQSQHLHADIMNLLPVALKQEVVSARVYKDKAIVMLKSSFAVMAVRHALRNLHYPVDVKVARPKY